LQKKPTHASAITEFFDLTPEEFQRKYLTLDISQLDLARSEAVEAVEVKSPRNLQTSSVPASFDWRSRNVVSPIRNQGSCGSCWSFASVSNIESKYAIRYKVLRQFSEQQLIDCDSSNSACNGGNAGLAFNYIKRVGGLMERSVYTKSLYLNKKSTCVYNKAKTVAKVTGFVNVGTNEETIKNYIYNYGPVAVAINASKLQYYYSGVIAYTDAQCNPKVLNHAVNIIGYGVTTAGLKYWIVRNTWGTTWGEKGYFRIKRGAGTCGINRFVLSATVA